MPTPVVCPFRIPTRRSYLSNEIFSISVPMFGDARPDHRNQIDKNRNNSRAKDGMFWFDCSLYTCNRYLPVRVSVSGSNLLSIRLP